MPVGTQTNPRRTVEDMYEVKPRNVYVHQRVLGDPDCAARMDRMMGCIEPDQPPITVDDAALNEVSEQKQWERVTRWRTGQYKRQRDPDIIFNSYTWDTPEDIAETNRLYPHLRFARLNGAGMHDFRDGRSLLERKDGVCQNAHCLHSAWGCLHACDYCNIGEFLNIHMNLEEVVAHLDELLDANPWQQLYKYDNQTDTITFEPEYGSSELMVGYFAGREREYLQLYTKSDNVDHLLGLDHNGHSIISFTISSETVAREMEKNAPSTSERIAAARKCQQAGYHVRVRFSPIMPVRNWREENATMIEELLANVKPDVITIDLLAHMPGERLDANFDTDLFDPEYLQKTRDIYAGPHPGVPISPAGKQIWHHADRATVYRHFLDQIHLHDPDCPVSFCDEIPAMWREFAPQLAGDPDDYACTCGPTCVPGNPLIRTTT